MSRLPSLLAALFLIGCGPNASSEEARGQATPPPPSPSADKKKSGPKPDAAAAPMDLKEAQAFAKGHIILDGHIDVPYRLEGSRNADGGLSEDVAAATEKGDFDYPRARAGGLDAPFMSIYVPARLEKEGGSRELADRLIDMVETLIREHPDKFAAARNPAEVRANFAAKKISLPMGMENGSPIEGKLENLRHFAERGIRYITLAHSKDNHLSDSSYDESHTHKGLSDFGKEVVAEMNKLGVMVDVSHLSDDAFWQVMELSAVPVIASHSSCRHFTPGFERNMSDEMIQALAKKGGVIQLNFGSSFLDAEVAKVRKADREARKAAREKAGLPEKGPETEAFEETWKTEHPMPVTTLSKVADHVMHVVQLVGIEHVGLGSDFDGVGDSLPTGLEDVSKYPALLLELSKRGLSKDDLAKISGENVLRVWEAVDAYARKSGSP